MQPLQDGETAKQLSTSKNRFLHERCKWHDAKNISDELCSCLEEWIPGYEEKLMKIYAVSDNTANVKAAMRRLNFKSLYCYAHTLQFVVNSIS